MMQARKETTVDDLMKREDISLIESAEFIMIDRMFKPDAISNTVREICKINGPLTRTQKQTLAEFISSRTY